MKPTDEMVAWIRKLRSGEYRHGTRCLRSGTPSGAAVYCCLGVLCDMQEGVEWMPLTTGSYRFRAIVGGELVSDVAGRTLDPRLMKAHGLTFSDCQEIAQTNDESDSYGPVIPVILWAWSRKGYDVSGLEG